MRVKMYRHLQRQSLSFFDRTPLGQLISRTNSDVEAISHALSGDVVRTIGDLLRC